MHGAPPRQVSLDCIRKLVKLGLVEHAINHSGLEEETGGSL